MNFGQVEEVVLLVCVSVAILSFSALLLAAAWVLL